MNTSDLSAYLTQALYLTLWLSLPVIGVAALVGTLVSLLQALTQVQDQTLAFAIKLIAVGLVLALTARWMGGELFNYTLAILQGLPTLAR
ncbi:type III secretion system export apparatus subunit SctS [Aquabacterium sp.]|uniref:type III secretion system export apparatus subunit SctS n=1 Tax=Aquabacterium sp. TaxID=1872578 RepID=UPI002CD7705B|nr:type III secretion system export apparatus subunit SctS [Aquabacterium sp.]HSW06927.1 type III secretion system export apparatus subunit SctS [Aquabacterium sp.]